MSRAASEAGRGVVVVWVPSGTDLRPPALDACWTATSGTDLRPPALDVCWTSTSGVDLRPQVLDACLTSTSSTDVDPRHRFGPGRDAVRPGNPSG